MKKRFIIKKKKIAGRGGGPKIDNFIIWDTKENRKYNDCIIERYAQELCDNLNKYEDKAFVVEGLKRSNFNWDK